jgi:hypothetical protein
MLSLAPFVAGVGHVFVTVVPGMSSAHLRQGLSARRPMEIKELPQGEGVKQCGAAARVMHSGQQGTQGSLVRNRVLLLYSVQHFSCGHRETLQVAALAHGVEKRRRAQESTCKIT